MPFRFNFNAEVNEVFQQLNIFFRSTTQPIKTHQIQVFWLRFDFTSKSFQLLEVFLLSDTHGEFSAVDNATR